MFTVARPVTKQQWTHSEKKVEPAGNLCDILTCTTGKCFVEEDKTIQITGYGLFFCDNHEETA